MLLSYVCSHNFPGTDLFYSQWDRLTKTVQTHSHEAGQVSCLAKDTMTATGMDKRRKEEAEAEAVNDINS